MPNLNDFHAFKSTSDGDNSGPGCSGNVIVWVVVICSILSVIGEFPR